MPLPRTHLFHPYLFAAYPILATLASNLGQVRADVAYQSLVFSILLALALLLVFRRGMSDAHSAAAATSLGLLLFFTYGHAYQLAKPIQLFGVAIGRHRYLAPGFLLLFIGALISLRRKKLHHQVVAALNIFGAVAVTLTLSRVVIFEFRMHLQQEREMETPVPRTQVQFEELPDIYFIILDAYTREDALSRSFDLNNRYFLSQLEELGFMIADCSQSNYAQTDLSLASTLNMNYLSELGNHFVPENDDRTEVFQLIRDSAVRRLLEGYGYQTISFETGYAWTELDDADFFLGPERDPSLLRLRPNAFESLLIRTTALSLVADASTIFLSAIDSGGIEDHASRVLFSLERLAEIPNLTGRKFVFAHIVAPHRPYVFKPTDGSNQRGSQEAAGPPERDYVTGYRNQVLYVNDRILQLLPALIQSSSVPPIIILQGDHGADEAAPTERMAILNALHLPGIQEDAIYPSISPVNTFRVILNHYFTIELEVLEDMSLYSDYAVPYNFKPISNTCGKSELPES